MQNSELIQKLSEAIEKSQSTIDDIEKHPEKTLGDSIDFSNCRNNNQWSGHTSIVSNNEAYTKKHLKRDVVAGSTGAGAFVGSLAGMNSSDGVVRVGKAIDKRLNPNVKDVKTGVRKAIEKAAKEGLNVYKIDPKKMTPEKRAALKKFLNNSSHKEVAKQVSKYSNWVKRGRAIGGLKGAAIGGAIGAAAGHGIIKLGDKLQKHLSKTKKKNS